MLVAVVSDIHANLPAFETVLRHVDARQVEQIWCLGDLAGYGPSPNECIDLLRRRKHICVVGNHDLAAVGDLPLDEFNPDAAAAALWTQRQLTRANTRYLRELPLSLVRDSLTLVHGSPRDPIWEYLVSPEDALLSFGLLQTPLAFVGHSHLPLVFEYDRTYDECEALQYPSDGPLSLQGRALILNPGSVGQPRDGDPRASYLLYDTARHTVRHYRLTYDVARVQRQIAEAHLPPRLAERLAFGW